MGSISVLISLENRSFELDLEDGDFFTLKASFLDFCKSDDCLKSRIKSYAPVFKAQSKSWNRKVELNRLIDIENRQEIFVEWSEIEKVVETRPSTSLQSSRSALQEKNDNEINNNSSSDEDDDDEMIKEVKSYYSEREWKEMSKIEKLAAKSSFERHTILKSMNLVKGDYVPFRDIERPNKKRKVQDHAKENQPPKKQIKKPVAPSRRSLRCRTVTPLVDHDEEAVDDPSNIAADQGIEISENETNFDPEHDKSRFQEMFGGMDSIEEAQLQPVQEKQTGRRRAAKPPKPKKAKKDPGTRRKPKRVSRDFGARINKTNALPDFSPALCQSLLTGKYSKMRLLMEIRDHIQLVTRGLYLTPPEWSLLCSAIVKKYPILCDVDQPDNFATLKRSIQKSITSKRFYENEREAVAVKDSPVQILIEPTTATPTQEHVTELLQNTADERRQLWLVKVTFKDRHQEVSKEGADMEKYLEKYPHYKNGKLFIYEYSMVTKISIETLHKNAESFLQQLRNHFQKEPVKDNIDVILHLQEILYPAMLKKRKEGSITRMITAMDVTEAEAEYCVMETSQKFHSPCVVLIVDHNERGLRVIKTCLLKIFSGTVSTLSEPTCSAVLLLVLAPYFLFDLQFPLAYNSILRLFELKLHGFLSESTRKMVVKKEYTNFLKSFQRL